MIELTVKTLDSRNHAFSVEDDITVEQFKIKIADTVNIPAETQRIIYCGRVLQDSAKLSDYDVNGKVVHLVQRAPPNAGQRNRSATPPPINEHGRRPRLFRGLDGNTMYLGSMAFPSNLMESQGIVPPPPTHSLAGSRLNVARRMLRRAEAVIRLLENPSARPNEQPSADDNQEEEEVTPVIEARVIVPSNGNEPIDQAMVLSAVQNSLMNAEAMVLNRRDTESNVPRSGNDSASSTPGDQTPPSSSAENAVAAAAPADPQNGTNAASPLSENTSRTSEMAELLTMLGQLQTRFAPFLENYQNFMRDDPVVTPENARQTRAMLTRVSEVLHFLGHAYHSLSDIIIRVRSPPPRPLLCRPILIQHSAVVHAGIPIQVEAQINVSSDNNRQTSTQNNSQSQSNASNENTPTTTNNTTNQNSTTATPPQQPTFTGIPSFFGATPTAVRVASLPVEIRAVRTGGSNTWSTTPITTASPQQPQQQQNQNNASGESGGAQQQSNDRNSDRNDGFNFNNPNVEFFMEVTPERITIDSLETTLVGSNQQANDLLRGALNGPPPEFLQSLMQMAGQIINRATPTQAEPPVTTTVAQQSNTSNNSTTSNGSSGPQTATTGAGQNSQARGNTQTNPTTATHTRSTSRPHVHLAQQAIQGGFDPFLPCNSHHVTHGIRSGSSGRRAANSATNNNNNSSNGSLGPTAADGPRNITVNIGGNASSAASAGNLGYFNILNGIVNSFRTAAQTNRTQPTPRHTANDSANAPSQNNPSTIELMPIYSLFSNLTGQPMSELAQSAPTLQQILQQFQQDDSYVQGESIFIDFLMLLMRNITLVDLFTLTNGLHEPLLRNRQEIRNFVRTRVLNGPPDSSNISGGTDRLIAEMQPFLQHFRHLPVRDNIDMVRSSENLFRSRFPELITTAANLESSNVHILIQAFVNTVKDLCALAMRSSASGQEGVEQLHDHILHNLMHDIPRDIQDWTLLTSRRYLRRILSNLNNREDNIRLLIVRRESQQQPVANVATAAQSATSRHEPIEEAMELDDQEATGSGSEFTAPTIVLENEPIADIVLGSEPWHGQVPDDWVPIIARDAQKQRRQNPQGPFSDAYLSGMPSKRRKLVNSAKPQGSLSQVISDSVRQAVSATGLAHVAPLETVVQAAGASTDIQQAYRSLLRSTVQNSLRENEDFSAERFPNASNYFNSSQQQ